VNDALPDDRIAENLAAVRSRLAQAAAASGRSPDQITLVAVSKTFPIEAVRAAVAAGQRDFGENRVQEGLTKIDALGDIAGVRWHLIGHLQSNKARKAARPFDVIHSIDALELLDRIDAAAVEQRRAPELLVQVDLAGEATKFGAVPAIVRRLLDRAPSLQAARIVGLMLIPPYFDNPEDTRPYFRRLREAREEWLRDGVDPAALRELSMGMSHDFEVAIAEGATIVRVGTAIFGRRQAPTT